MIFALFLLTNLVQVFGVPTSPSSASSQPPSVDESDLADEVSKALTRIRNVNGPFTDKSLYKLLHESGKFHWATAAELDPIFSVVKSGPINVNNLVQENVSLKSIDTTSDIDESEAAVIEENNIVDLTGEENNGNEDKQEISDGELEEEEEQDSDINGNNELNDAAVDSDGCEPHSQDFIDLINCDPSDNDNDDAVDVDKLKDIEILTKLNVYSDDDDVVEGLEPVQTQNKNSREKPVLEKKRKEKKINKCKII